MHVLLIAFVMLQATSQEPTVQHQTPARHEQKRDGDRKQKAPQAIVVAQTPPARNETTPNQNQRQGQSDGPPYPVKVVSEPTNRWNVAYVLITGAIGVFGFISVVLLWLQNKAAHNAERGRMDIILRAIPGSTAAFQMELLNFGKSAAHLMDEDIFLSYESNPAESFKTGRTITHAYRNEIMLAGGKAEGVRIIDLAHHVIEQDTASGGTPVVRVRLTYRDIFNKMRYTEVVYSFGRLKVKFEPKHAKYK